MGKPSIFPFDLTAQIVKLKTLLLTSAGSSLIGFIQSGTGAVLRTLQAKNRDTLDLRDFGVVGTGDEGTKILAAMVQAEVSGRLLLWPAGNYQSSIALSVGAVRMRATGPVRLTYSGATHIARFVGSSASGVGDIWLLGKWTINGNNKTNLGLDLVNDNDTLIDIVLGDVRAENCKKVSGGPAGSNAGIQIRGKFDLTFDNLVGKNTTREAGTGTPSVSGSIGVDITYTSATRGPRKINGNVIGSDTVTTADTPGNVACVDCDGIVIYQNDVEGAECNIKSWWSKNAQGRQIKTQNFRSVNIGPGSYYRNISGITGGSVEINLQFFEGSVGDISGRYEGDSAVVFGQGIDVLSGYAATARTGGYGPLVATTITIRNDCTGTTYGNSIFQPIQASASTDPVFAALSNVVLIGGGWEYLADIGGTGGTSKSPIDLRMPAGRGEIRTAMIKTNSSVPLLTAHFQSFRQTGTEVPALESTSGPVGNNFGHLHDLGGNVGIKRMTTNGDLPSILSEGDGVYLTTDTSLAILRSATLYRGLLGAGVEIALPLYGNTQGTGTLTAVNFTYPGLSGIYTTAAGSATVTTVQALAGLTTGSAGVEPAGTDLAIWKNAGTDVAYLKNRTASPVYIALVWTFK